MNSETPTTPVLINADDFGLSDGVCRGILELIDTGAVSNTTIMAAAPGAAERSRRWRVADLRGIAGVHLQLSGGLPLSSASEAPSLVDPSTGGFVPREVLPQVDPDDVRLEWSRQIELVSELLGTAPTHLDSHQGAHRLPNCVDIYLSLAVEYGLPVRGYDSAFSEKMSGTGVRGSSRLIREWTGHSLGPTGLIELLLRTADKNAPGAVVEVVSHPGYVDDYLVSVSSLTQQREEDMLALRALASDEWLPRNGFELVSYPLFAAVSPHD